MGLDDVRPPALDLLFRPGTTVSRTLVWPAGELAGRTFTSTLDAEALDVTILGDDTMTIEATVAETGAHEEGVPAGWLLLEDIDGTDEPVMVGTWTPSFDPRALDPADPVTVTVGGSVVMVTVTSSQASVAALDARVDTAETDIDALQVADVALDGRLDTAEATITSHGTRLDTVEGDVALVETDLTTHEAAEGAHGWTVVGTTIAWNGAIRTNHDVKYFEADRIRSGTAQFVDNAGTLNGPPHWAFDASVVERIKWKWTPGDAWSSYVVRLGWINGGFASGNVRWRYYERRTVVNASSPSGDWTTAPTQVAEITSAAPLLNANKYEDLAVGVPVTPLTVVMSVIERITVGVPSNLGNDAGLYIVTATRT